jgi:hypothetical protein
MVLVIAGDEATARWASRLPRAGDPSGWRAQVAMLDALPRITDPLEVAANPLRAVLCALGHVEQEVFTALGGGLELASLPRVKLDYYLNIIFSKAPAGLLEIIMQDPKQEFLSDFARSYLAKGKQEGREEGGLEAGRKHVRAVLAKRRIALSPEDEKRIETCSDVATLDRWHDRALDARAIADVFADD